MPTPFSSATKIMYCYPGGNDTHITVNPTFTREEYGRCDQLIRSKYPNLEQGGFLEKPKNSLACAHLQMAGGEFCGNALRSMGALLAADYRGARTLSSLVQYDRVEKEGENIRIPVTISSCDQVLYLAIEPGKGSRNFQVSADIPLPTSATAITSIELSKNDASFHATKVDMGGIVHILIDEGDLPFNPDRAAYEEYVRDFVVQAGLADRAAVGLIWCSDGPNGTRRIDPVVWVKSVDSCYYESACGSGSMAVAIAESWSKQSDIRLSVSQPSDDVVTCTIIGVVGTEGCTKGQLSGNVGVVGDLNIQFATVQNSDTVQQPLVEPRTLKGFKDRLPAEALIKGGMIAELRSVFESFGYVPIETPHLEYRDVLVKQGSTEIQKQLYSFTDHGGRPVALRFDLTVPFARFISQHKNELGLPFKRYAVGNVFRGENTQAGRYREFTQCDFDFVGVTSLGADAEVVEVIVASLERLGIEDFTVRLNNRKIINGMMRYLASPELTTDALRVIDKLDRDGFDKTRAGLLGIGLTPGQATTLLKFSALKQEGDSEEFFHRVAEYAGYDPLIREGIAELRDVTEALHAAGVDARRFAIDFSIARGLGYYTGIVYETVLNNLPSIGSVCSGGRYDNLTKTFSSTPIPGVGASVGLDRLIAALEELGLSNTTATSAAALVFQTDDRFRGEARHYASQLRQAGVNVELYPAVDSAGPQFNYAKKRGHKYAIMIGSQEIDGDFVTIKEIESRVVHRCSTLEQAVALLKGQPTSTEKVSMGW
jgi:histidyl-tRNA synthetase